MNNKLAYRWLTQQQPARRWLFISIFLGLTSGLLIIAQSGLLATIIDRVYLHHATRTQLLLLLSLFFGIIIIKSGVAWLREIIGFQTARCVRFSADQSRCGRKTNAGVACLRRRRNRFASIQILAADRLTARF